MAKAKPASKPPSPYELLGLRIQRVITHPRSQLARSALLERLPTDTHEDWDRMLDEISENDNVTLTRRDDGDVQVSWALPKED